MQLLLEKIQSFLKRHRAFLMLFAIFFGVYFLWWAAFFPGVMTGDSLDQWRQALHANYNNAHPFMSTIYMNAFRGIKDTPAWVSLTQVITTSITLASFLAYGYRKNLPKKAIAIVTAFFIIWPIYGIYTITIWKDILYSIAILAVSLLCYVLVADKKVADKKYPYVILVVAALVVALWRHNGTIYLVLPFIGLGLFSKPLRKAASISGIITIVLYVFIHFTVGGWLNVQPAPIMAEWLRMKTVAAVYNEDHPTISKQDNAVFTSFMPASTWRDTYNCHQTDNTFLEFYKHDPIGYTDQVSKNPQVEAAWKKAVIDAAIHNPHAIMKDHMCVAKNLLRTNAGFMKYSDAILIRSDLPYVVEHPMFHTTRFKLKEKAFLGWTTKYTATNFIFWSSIPASILSGIYLILAIKYRLKATIVFILLTLANPLCVIAIGSASDYRYIYNLLLSAPLIPLAFMIETRIVLQATASFKSKQRLFKKS